MLKISLSPEAKDKFAALLKQENESAVLRIRETKVGVACKSHIELRLSIDEREDAAEEQEGVFEGMPFVVNNDVIDSYGETYAISLNAEQLPVVKAE